MILQKWTDKLIHKHELYINFKRLEFCEPCSYAIILADQLNNIPNLRIPLQSNSYTFLECYIIRVSKSRPEQH